MPAHSGRWPLPSRRGPRAAGAARFRASLSRPRPNDACTAEGGFLPPRARPRAGGRVFAPSPTLLGPFAPQRVAAAHRGDVAEGFEASCCLPLAMTVRACTSTCDCTATVAPTAVGEHEMGSKGSAAKAGGRLEPPSTLAPCCAGSTATVGSRVCDFACSTDAGVRVELTTSLTRPVPTSDAERPLALAVKSRRPREAALHPCLGPVQLRATPAQCSAGP